MTLAAGRAPAFEYSADVPDLTRARPKRATKRAQREAGGIRQAEAFLADLEARRVSPNTVRAYRADIVQLLAWLEDRRQTVLDLDRTTCRKYASSLASSGAAPSTIARKVTSMKAFVGFLSAAGAVSPDAVDGIRTPRRPKSLPAVISQEEAVRIIDAAYHAAVESGLTSDFLADFRSDFQGEFRDEICQRIRELALLEILYGCGLRAAEVCELRLSDIRRDQGMLIVRGKGEKTRMVPYAPATLRAIDAWLAIRPAAKSDHLLLTVNQKPLNTSDVRRIVRAAGARVGIEIHPHSMRHACATHLMERGADIRAIQELLGHASITTTQIYTRVTGTHLRAVYNTAHPRAREEA